MTTELRFDASKSERDQVVIFAPRRSAAERRMFPWFDSIGNAKLLEAAATETLRSVRADLVVIVGEGFLDEWIDLDRKEHRTLLRGKYVYHIGWAPKDIDALIASGIKGYLGFERFVF